MELDPSFSFFNQLVVHLPVRHLTLWWANYWVDFAQQTCHELFPLLITFLAQLIWRHSTSFSAGLRHSWTTAGDEQKLELTLQRLLQNVVFGSFRSCAQGRHAISSWVVAGSERSLLERGEMPVTRIGRFFAKSTQKRIYTAHSLSGFTWHAFIFLTFCYKKSYANYSNMVAL